MLPILVFPLSSLRIQNSLYVLISDNNSHKSNKISMLNRSQNMQGCWSCGLFVSAEMKWKQHFPSFLVTLSLLIHMKDQKDKLRIRLLIPAAFIHCPLQAFRLKSFKIMQNIKFKFVKCT